MEWDWLVPGALVCALVGWLLRLTRPDAPRRQLAANILLIGGLTVAAAVVALYVAFFSLLLYTPAVWIFDDGWPLTVTVWLQATLMIVAVVAALRRNLVSRLPVLVFVMTTLGFGAWLFLHPLEWLPAPS